MVGVSVDRSAATLRLMPAHTYLTRPATVHAVRCVGTIDELLDFLGGPTRARIIIRPVPRQGGVRGMAQGVVIDVDRQHLVAHPGDWVIRAPDGRYHVLDDTTFNDRYIQART